MKSTLECICFISRNAEANLRKVTHHPSATNPFVLLKLDKLLSGVTGFDKVYTTVFHDQTTILIQKFLEKISLILHVLNNHKAGDK